MKGVLQYILIKELQVFDGNCLLKQPEETASSVNLSIKQLTTESKQTHK